MAAGAANAINMVLDRDIDAKMHRTVRRPTVTRELSTTAVLAFAAALSAGSFGVLALAANLLTAALAAAGLLYYVVIYTIGVKRRTWQNIVIGGAAGAFPPLVGWAAVTGELNALAWVLFAIIFVWTPVHFWALALLIKDDYAAARVPMLPVVRGERATVIQISGYAALTAVVSTLPVLHGHVSSAYLVASLCLNGLLLLNTARLAASPDRPRALSLFKFSMAYLALLFLALAIDRSLYGTVLLAAARATGQAG
jgi:protoheme IX farnesyltransferase